MSEENKLPVSPNEKPWALHTTQPHWLHNTIASLNQFSAVDIHWENDWRVSNETGEPAGKWDVSIETVHGKRFSCSHEEIENALWYVTTLAENSESEEWKKQEEARNAALAKLSPEEKRLLRIR